MLLSHSSSGWLRYVQQQPQAVPLPSVARRWQHLMWRFHVLSQQRSLGSLMVRSCRLWEWLFRVQMPWQPA
jgi:hypothetical protein